MSWPAGLGAQDVVGVVEVHLDGTAVGFGDEHSVGGVALGGFPIDLTGLAARHCLHGRRAGLIGRRHIQTVLSLPEVAELVATGSTNAEIADVLVISVGTVKTHVHSIRRKLGFRNRVQIAVWVLETRESWRRVAE